MASCGELLDLLGKMSRSEELSGWLGNSRLSSEPCSAKLLFPENIHLMLSNFGHHVCRLRFRNVHLMDPLKVLSRLTRFGRNPNHTRQRPTPSNGQDARPLSLSLSHTNSSSATHGKRKITTESVDRTELNSGEAVVDFFDAASTSRNPKRRKSENELNPPWHEKERGDATSYTPLPTEECRRLLHQHKVKIVWLNQRPRSRKRGDKVLHKSQKHRPVLCPQPLQSLSELPIRYDISKRLANNILGEGFTVPTEVQFAAIPLLLGPDTILFPKADPSTADSLVHQDGIDLLTVAPTGSGKTLAFLIPLIHAICQDKKDAPERKRQVSALILAPTKELAGQIVNEGRKLTRGMLFSISQAKKGMLLSQDSDMNNGDNEQNDDGVNIDQSTMIKADILVATPGILQSMVAQIPAQRNDALVSVQWLVLDEADVLLDPLFREQTRAVWDALPNPNLRVSLWSATMGSSIEELTQSIIDARRRRLSNAVIQDTPLIRLVVGLKDSALPNIEHKLTYAATEQGKLMGLRQLLHPTANDAGPTVRPPFLVFTQTIERARALHSELLYDIPIEAGGISRIAVLHSELSDASRDRVMTRFRRGEVWVLITTDLLSRGVDFRGINAVVNYDIPTSSAAYVHRVGRTGRAGREGGVAVTFYSTEDIPYLKHIANVISATQQNNGDNDGVQQWLLDALPKLSKNSKRKLKSHGIESRTARGREIDPEAARKSRISTRSGYIRRVENNRRGATDSSRRRKQAENDSIGSEDSDFSGFG